MQYSGLLCRNTSQFQYFLCQKHVVYFPALRHLLSLKKNVVNQISYWPNIKKERTTFRVDQRDIIKNLSFFSTDQIIIVQVKGLPAVLNFLFSCAKTFVLSSYNGSLGNLPDDCFLEAAGIIQRKDLRSFGFVFNEDKSCWLLKQTGEWLGFWVNTILIKFQVPEKKSSKAQNNIRFGV